MSTAERWYPAKPSADASKHSGEITSRRNVLQHTKKADNELHYFALGAPHHSTLKKQTRIALILGVQLCSDIKQN
jgi:hypothetical protein